jgi:integrase
VLRRLLATNARAATLLIRAMVAVVFVSEGIQKFLFSRTARCQLAHSDRHSISRRHGSVRGRLADIRRREVRELVDGIARKRDAPIMANRTLGVLSRMFNFALDREWIEANPASRIPEPGEEQSRDRVLSDEELRELWAALECLASQDEEETDKAAQELRRAKARLTPATAQAFQVQLLTAQRPGETRKMRWTNVDLASGWWTIPATVRPSSHGVEGNGRSRRPA